MREAPSHWRLLKVPHCGTSWWEAGGLIVDNQMETRCGSMLLYFPIHAFVLELPNRAVSLTGPSRSTCDFKIATITKTHIGKHKVSCKHGWILSLLLHDVP